LGHSRAGSLARMAINVRRASNIDRRIDASVPVALCPQPDSCTAAKQHNCFINSSHGHQNFRDFKDQKTGR